jgi:hypothetical protein
MAIDFSHLKGQDLAKNILLLIIFFEKIFDNKKIKYCIT